VITSILGLLRLGFLDVVLSRALLRGFITAVGIVSQACSSMYDSLTWPSQIIFIEQLVPMLGMTAILAHPEAKADPPTLPISKLLFVLRHLEHVNKTTAILSFTSLAVLIAARTSKQAILRRPGTGWVRYVPEILLVVAGTTGETYLDCEKDLLTLSSPKCHISMGSARRRGAWQDQR